MKLFEGPLRFASLVRKELTGLFTTKEEPVLEKIHPDTIFWKSTGNYLFLQDGKY